jgi:hypothetical protein
VVYLLISGVIATAAATAMHSRSQFAVLADPPISTVPVPRYLVLMVLDGGRPDYFGLTPLPHVDALRVDGTQFTDAMDGILESETPSGHTTLATGSSPARNGILGFDWAQSDSDYSIFSPDIVRAGAMEHIMEASGVPTIAGLFKKRYPKAKVVALSGHKYYAADPLGGPNADVIMYYQGDPKGRYIPVSIPGHSPPNGILTDPHLIYPNSHHVPPTVEDTLATNLAIKTFHALHQQITLINYPEFDWPLGHVNGGNEDPKAVITLMKGFDRDLGMIEDTYRKAGVLGQTLFVITADHGMSPVSRFIPSTVVSSAVSQAGTTAPAVSSSTGDYVWLADSTKASTVAANVVKEHDTGVESVYYLTSSRRGSAYVRAGGSFVSPQVEEAHQFLLKTLLNGHQPNLVLFANRGNTFASPDTHWLADHGGANWESQHIPLIMAGPGIHGGLISGAPVQLEDIAPTVLADMRVSPVGMEGKILTDALRGPSTPAEVRARVAEIRQLTPLTGALIAQDAYESSEK